jgi:hypothetical protein
VDPDTVKKALNRSNGTGGTGPVIYPPAVGTAVQASTPSDASTRLLLLEKARSALPSEPFIKGAQCAPLQGLLKWLLSESGHVPMVDRQRKHDAAMTIMEALAGNATFKTYSEAACDCSLRQRWEVELKGSQHLYTSLLKDRLGPAL